MLVSIPAQQDNEPHLREGTMRGHAHMRGGGAVHTCGPAALALGDLAAHVGPRPRGSRRTLGQTIRNYMISDTRGVPSKSIGVYDLVDMRDACNRS